MDYGLAYGLSVAEPTLEDAEYVLTWITAATEVSPDLAEAYIWRYDLLSRLGRSDEALAALEAYCRYAPTDLPARLNLIDILFQRARTAEERIDVCNAQLQTENLAPEVASDLHRRLAEIHLNRASHELALHHAKQATESFAQNLPAQTLLAEIEGRLRELATPIDLLLREIAANPASVDAAWRLALALDTLALHTEAQVWYEAAMQAFARRNALSRLPAELLLDQARSYFDAGDDEQAAICCKRILAADPAAAEAEMLLIQVARHMGRDQLAGAHTAALATRFRELEMQAVEERDATTCHRIAAFHVDIQPQPRRALKFARLADHYQPHDPRIRRTLGAAYVEAEKYAEALEVLAPLANTDQYAALAQARAQRALGQTAAAADTLRQASALRYSGITYRRIVERLRDLHQPPASPPDSTAVRALLDQFDYDLLDFPLHAPEVLDFRVNIAGDVCPFGHPLRARFTLANKGTYPVTLGEELMLNPHISVSVKDAASQGAILDDYLSVSFNTRCVLRGGQKIETEEYLSTATAIPLLRHQPQRRLALEFTFVLDPVMLEDGAISSALIGGEPVTIRVTRPPVDASVRGIEHLADRLRTGTEAQRLCAIETALALTLERYESLQDKPHTYSAVRVDGPRLTGLLLEALTDATPVVRARAMAALLYVQLDEEGLNAAAPLISDSNWLPRMLAVEMFAKKHGPVFLPVLERLAEDRHPLVAKLARLYRDRAQELRPEEQRDPQPANPFAEPPEEAQVP